ncbi:MAG: aminopeptidase P family protein [Alphaproteobacteria bacterium]
MSDLSALAARLSRPGARLRKADLTRLIDGVLAAPKPMEPDSWLDLFSDRSEADRQALKDALIARRDSKAPNSFNTTDQAGRLTALRREMAAAKLDILVVPKADEHQGEYLPLKAERLQWLTGFTGSAGAAAIGAKKAAMFTDGRYTLQVKDEVPASEYEYKSWPGPHLVDWIAEQNLPKGARIGFDPMLMTDAWATDMQKKAREKGWVLVPTDGNLVDRIWTDQPPAPISPIRPHALEYAGESAADKRARLAQDLRDKGEKAAILSAPDSIAWLLNIRGGDVPCTPFALSFAVLKESGKVDWYVDKAKLTPGLLSHLGEGVRIRRPDSLIQSLEKLGQKGAKVRINSGSVPFALSHALKTSGAELSRGADPCSLPKAIKNKVEIAGSEAAHKRDGVAIVRFLHWLDREAPKGGLDEISASDKLLEFRKQGKNFRDISFDTISGAGPNGAIVHYHATENSKRKLEAGQMYLVDSGGQYLDGTTDITRTVVIGDNPTAEMREHYTRVLKGHIAVAKAKIPAGQSGQSLDVLARASLWEAGLDFAHGTGHGVGSYLSVHEGPQGISSRNSTPLKPGMIVSNEPGYYRAGKYGIRLENLIVFEAAESSLENKMLQSRDLTLAPFDRRLIVDDMLTRDELAWLNAYHAKVRQDLTPELGKEDAQWLAQQCAPIGPVGPAPQADRRAEISPV